MQNAMLARMPVPEATEASHPTFPRLHQSDVRQLRGGPALSKATVPELLHALLIAIAPTLDNKSRHRLARGLLKHASGPKPKEEREKELTISELCRRFCEHADGYYRKPDGTPTGEPTTVLNALLPLRKMFGRRPVGEFGPLKLKEVREEMIRLNWSRKHINQQVGRIKKMFKWGVGNEMIPSHLFHALQSVAGLRPGRSAARESEPVKPVADELVEAVIPHVSAQVAAIIRLQLVAGMRSGEVVIMRACDIDMTGQPWVYKPSHHKTEHHGHERVVLLGPQAQQVIQPFLVPNQPSKFLFSAADAEQERLKKLHARRITPMSCGNKPGSNRRRRPQHQPGERYNPQSYGRAIARACEIAFPIPEGLSAEQSKLWRKKHHWHPHQLRHNAATRLRKQYGLDVAQVVLGHKTLAVTQVYAEKDVETAKRVMAAHG